MKTDKPLIRQLVSALLAWFARNARDLPWRRTSDPYGIWVSEIMLQQTQVKTVIPYWERWMRELPDIRSLAESHADEVHKLWEGLGYYTRVRNMQKAAQIIVEKHGCVFPGSFEDILALPGIGRYTAGAISSIAFNQPTPILDGNVIRVLTRVFGIAENPREKTTNARLWQLAGSFVREAALCIEHKFSCSHLNQSLMELGALICTPRSPGCDVCPLQKHCVAHREQRVEELPNLPARATVTERRFVAFVLENRGKVLLQQRPAGGVNAHLWEFPNLEIKDGKTNYPEFAQKVFFKSEVQLKKLCTIKHSITRYRITLEAWRGKLNSQVKTGEKTVFKNFGATNSRWLTTKDADSLAFTSAHRKILNRLLRDKKSTQGS